MAHSFSKIKNNFIDHNDFDNNLLEIKPVVNWINCWVINIALS